MFQRGRRSLSTAFIHNGMPGVSCCGVAGIVFEIIGGNPSLAGLRLSDHHAISARQQRSRRENPGHQDSDAIRAPSSGLKAYHRRSRRRRSIDLPGSIRRFLRRCAKPGGNRQHDVPGRYPAGRSGAIVRGRAKRPVDYLWSDPIFNTSCSTGELTRRSAYFAKIFVSRRGTWLRPQYGHS